MISSFTNIEFPDKVVLKWHLLFFFLKIYLYSSGRLFQFGLQDDISMLVIFRGYLLPVDVSWSFILIPEFFQ